MRRTGHGMVPALFHSTRPQSTMLAHLRVFFHLLLMLVVPLLLSSGCARHAPPPQPPEPVHELTLARLGHTVQVGAFRSVEQAANLTELLRKQSCNSYYFRDKSGLYKVRFGNFATPEQANAAADALLQAGLIEEFLVVQPESYAVARLGTEGDAFLRAQLVSTAESFLGILYKWGGESGEEGFDCSGLVMAVYQLNGLDLPRSSQAQFQIGKQVEIDQLKRGDLVFFATSGGKQVSHVGVYAGNKRFIHAPKKGKPIQIASLDNSYFRGCYLGGRTYLGGN